MTGYSFKEQLFDGSYISTEIKTVNSRFLDMNINLPFYINFMEINIRDLLKNKIIRGKVDINISLKLDDSLYNVSVDLNMAKQYIDNLNKIINKFNLKDDVKLFHLTRYENIINTEKKKDFNKYWKIISKSINENIIEVMEMRKKEGDAIKKDLFFLLKRLKKNLDLILRKIPKIELVLYNNLKNKIFELTKNHLEDNRLLSEVALLVSKSCVNEEVKRLESYLDQFYLIIEEKNEIGKKLDFICQEMHREINTIGSKISNADLTGNVIEIKNDIEKMREHIRNIE